MDRYRLTNIFRLKKGPTELDKELPPYLRNYLLRKDSSREKNILII